MNNKDGREISQEVSMDPIGLSANNQDIKWTWKQSSWDKMGIQSHIFETAELHFYIV